MWKFTRIRFCSESIFHHKNIMYYSIYSSIVFFLMHNAFSWQMGWYLKERLFSVYCNRYGWFILMSITYIIPQKARFFALIILKIYFCQIFEKWPFSRTFFRFSQKAPIRILCFKVFYNHRGVLFKAKKVSSFELKFFFQTRSSPVWNYLKWNLKGWRLKIVTLIKFDIFM